MQSKLQEMVACTLNSRFSNTNLINTRMWLMSVSSPECALRDGGISNVILEHADIISIF